MPSAKLETRVEKLVPLFLVNQRPENILRIDMEQASGIPIRTIGRITNKITTTDTENRALELSKKLTVFGLIELEKLLEEKKIIRKKRGRKSKLIITPIVELFLSTQLREDITRSEIADAIGKTRRSGYALTKLITATDPDKRALVLSKNLTVFELNGLKKLLSEKGIVPKPRKARKQLGKVQKEIASSKKLQEEVLKKMLKNKF